MTDIVSLVLGLPATVEGIIKTCNAVQRYRGLHEDHKLAINRAVFGSKKLVYYIGFIDTEPLKKDAAISETMRHKLLEEALLHASDAVLTMARVVENWTVRLGLNTSSDGRQYMAKLATAIAEKLSRNQKIVTATRFNSSAIGKLGMEVAYLASGSRQINEAMEALERWTGNLRDVLLSFRDLKCVLDTSQSVDAETLQAVADDVLFVSRCIERVDRKAPVQRIEASEIESHKDIDVEYPTGFLVIEKGLYMGCIIDRRDMNYLYAQEKEDQAIMETDHISRLFAEERSGTARIASRASAGILSCCGWALTSSRLASTEHDLVFRPPPGTRHPRTLRMLLLHGAPRHSLDARLQFSIQLATSILITHSLNLVHKDIRPDSILVFEPLNAKEHELFPYKLGSPYLANFDRARSENVDTVINPFQFSPYMRIAYTHPIHTTTDDHIRYQMRDDIYSLGVVLIEVALWKSLFCWSEFRQCYDADFSWFDFSAEKYKKMFIAMGQPEYRNRGWLMQYDLIELAEREIPVVMGSTFKDVVVACLMFGETDKPTLSNSVLKIRGEGHDPREESVTFVQNVLAKLRSLNFS